MIRKQLDGTLVATSTEWTAENPVLREGQIGVVLNSAGDWAGLYVVGVDGVAYSSLPQFTFGGRGLIVAPEDVADSSGNNTLTNLTGLSFAVKLARVYRFRSVITYTSAATTTGAIFTITGPAMTFCNYRQTQTLDATTASAATQVAIELPSAAVATSLTTGNIAVVEGIFKPSADGTVQVQFATEVASSAITCLAGSYLEYERLL